MLQATIREGQQRSIQGALGVLQYGIVLVDVLHYFRVEFILLEQNQSYVIFTINLSSRSLSVKGERGRADQGQNSALASFNAEERSNDDPANHESLANIYAPSAGVND